MTRQHREWLESLTGATPQQMEQVARDVLHRALAGDLFAAQLLAVLLVSRTERSPTDC